MSNGNGSKPLSNDWEMTDLHRTSFTSMSRIQPNYRPDYTESNQGLHHLLINILLSVCLVANNGDTWRYILVRAGKKWESRGSRSLESGPLIDVKTAWNFARHVYYTIHTGVNNPLTEREKKHGKDDSIPEWKKRLLYNLIGHNLLSRMKMRSRERWLLAVPD